MAIRQFRKQWLKWHDGYERKAFRIIRKHLKEHALKIPFERSNEFNVIAFLELYTPIDVFNKMYLEIYSEVGLKHGKRVGAYINKQINQKDFTFDRFAGEFLANVQRMLLGDGGARIVTVRENYIKFLMELITKEYNDQKTTSEIATSMVKYIRSRNFYRYQALRIARTETTTASNYAAYSASLSSKVQMEKVWLSSQDARTRRPPTSHFDHYDMNEKRVDLEEAFNVSGEMLLYPGDQKNGSAGNIINCRCTIAQVVKRDENGNVIRTDGRRTVSPPRVPTQAQVQPQVPETPEVRFTPAKSIKEANEYARKQLGLRYADYRGLDLRVANETNEIYSKTKQVMPKLRSMGVGSAQKANRAMKNEVLDLYRKSKYYDDLVKRRGVDYAEKTIKRWANQKIGRVGSNTLAWSTNRGSFSTTGIDGKTITVDLSKYNGVYVNEKFGKSADVLDDIVKMNTDSGWFYKGGKGIKSIIAHELGHEIDKTLMFRNYQGFISIYNREHAKGIQHVIDALSKYGATAGGKASHKPFEMIAEAWAEYTTVANPRPLAKEIGELMLEQYYLKYVRGNTTLSYSQWLNQTLKILKG